jgi:hypothetical protein
MGWHDNYRLGATQTILAGTATSAAITNAFGSQTYAVRISTTSAMHIKTGDNVQVATLSDLLIPPNWADVVIVNPGQRMSAIADTVTSTITVTELT